MRRRYYVALAATLLSVTLAAAAHAADDETLKLYQAKCQSCHLADGKGPLPPMDLADGEWIHGSRHADLVKVISEGVPGTGMLPFKDQLTRAQIEALAKYVRSFDKSAKAKAAPGKGK